MSCLDKNVNRVLSISWYADLFPQQLVDILYENQNVSEEQRQTVYDFDKEIDEVQSEVEDFLSQVKVKMMNK